MNLYYFTQMFVIAPKFEWSYFNYPNLIEVIRIHPNINETAAYQPNWNEAVSSFPILLKLF